MPILDLSKIDMEKLLPKLEEHENKWVAISPENSIVSSGNTYKEALEKAQSSGDVVLFKMPRLDVFWLHNEISILETSHPSKC